MTQIKYTDKVFDQLSEVIKLKPELLNSCLKNTALNGLSLMHDIIGYEKYLKRPRVQIIYIHHMMKDEEKPFRQLIERLQKNHSIISYSEAVAKILNNEIDKPYIAFSSDDGLKNNVQAAKVLNDYDISACFFVNTSIVSETNLSNVKKHCKEVLDFPLVEFLDWDDILFLQNSGHEIGSHSMLHTDLTKLSYEETCSDLATTFQLLTKYCGTAKHFAFPFGTFSHYNNDVRKACFDTGFLSCASAVRGCHINGEEKINPRDLCLRRDHMILGWKLRHIMYFIENNAKKASLKNNFFPACI